MAGFRKGSVAHIKFLVGVIMESVNDNDVDAASEFVDYLYDENPQIANALVKELAEKHGVNLARES